MPETSSPSLTVGSWAFSAAHGESVRILDVESVWDHTVYEVWIPRLATVERVAAESLAPFTAHEGDRTGPHRLRRVLRLALPTH